MQKTSKTEALEALAKGCPDYMSPEFEVLRSFINASPDTGEVVAWRLNTVSGGHAFTEDAAYAAKCGAEPLFTHPVTPEGGNETAIRDLIASEMTPLHTIGGGNPPSYVMVGRAEFEALKAIPPNRCRCRG